MSYYYKHENFYIQSNFKIDLPGFHQRRRKPEYLDIVYNHFKNFQNKYEEYLQFSLNYDDYDDINNCADDDMDFHQLYQQLLGIHHKILGHFLNLNLVDKRQSLRTIQSAW